MLQDLAYALRQLRRAPAFAAAAILTLALGIGSNTAIYQVLDAVAFHSLPVHDPQSLVRLQILEDGKPLNFSYPLYREMAARQQVASGMFAVSDYPLHAAILRGRGPARTVNAVLASGGYFSVLGVAARLGRVFTEADDQASAPPVAVISDSFWEREFGRGPEALGQPLEINKAVVTIAGVASPEFYGETQGNAPDVWLPMSVAPQAMATDWLNAPKSFWLTAMARLRPGVSQAAARQAFESLYRQMPDLSERHGGSDFRIEVQPGSRGVAELQERFESPLLVLMAVVGMVLLIACCNLANLLLGRAAARSHEFGVRLALGAERARLMRQVLSESLVLAAIGGAAALALAHWGAMALVQLAAEGRSWRVPLGSGWRVLAFTAGVSAAATCFFGLAPAWSAARVDPYAALQSNRGQTGSRRRRVLGEALVVAQISMSLVLLAGSALLVRSLWSLRRQDFGFRGEHVLMVDLPWEFSPAMMARYKALSQPLYDAMNQLPGVRSAALSCFGPMGGDQHTGPLSSAERPAKRDDLTRIVHVSPRYFETMGIRIVAGRGITAGDSAGAPNVAVLSETAARQVFGGANAAGRLVTLGNRFDATHAVEVVGVARDVRFASPGEPFGFLVYVPMAQSPAPITAVVLRTAGDPAPAAGNVQAAFHAIDPGMAIGAIRSAGEVIDAKLSHERLLALLAMSFGLLALVLTSVGVYGVISYAMGRRTREIGIRLALGATRAQVSATLMKQVGLLVLSSAALGGAGAVAMTRALRSMIFAFGPGDFTLLAAVGLFLLMVASLAGYLPARRAARRDPVEALREP
ncbi:MAG TPA: ABC transporter permease [Bryobacteraceae bacterium]|nr:ABC transporter permease [Bryobacteraceae bacterium]